MKAQLSDFFCHATRLTALALALLGMGAAVSNAKDLAAYHVGDTVDQDIVTPVALNVLDPAATATLKSSEALKTPAVFRLCPAVTNALAVRFQQAFDRTRSNFVSALQETFHQTVLDHATITSPDFGYLVTAFNIDNKQFPIPGYLAMDWAYGKDGAIEKVRWLNSLLDLMQYPIRPDDLPAGFTMGDSLEFITVGKLDEKLTPGDVPTRAQLVPATYLATVGQARTQLHREFSSYDDLPVARTLALWVKPNCLPDAPLTQATRDGAVRRLVVDEYYAAGQLIATRGSVVDQKIKAALDELKQQSTAPAAAPVIVAAATVHEPAEPTVALNVTNSAPVGHLKSVAFAEPMTAIKPLAENSPAKRKGWLLAGAAFALAVLAVAIVRLSFRRRRILTATQVVKNLDSELQNSRRLQTELAPQLVQIVRQAFVQELAGQRRDLLVAQQTAATEVIRLVQRMDDLQVVMQERLRTYESQIQKLEAELTARTEENRQLIRLKIQMIRHQVESESAAKRIEFN